MRESDLRQPYLRRAAKKGGGGLSCEDTKLPSRSCNGTGGLKRTLAAAKTETTGLDNGRLSVMST